MLKRRIAVLTTLVVFAGGVGIAEAAPTKRTITAKDAGNFHIEGKVKSKKKSCSKQAFVQIFQVADGEDPQVRSFFTNKKGKYTTDTAGVEPLEPGTYYAATPKLGGCSKSKSEQVTLLPIR